MLTNPLRRIHSTSIPKVAQSILSKRSAIEPSKQLKPLKGILTPLSQSLVAEGPEPTYGNVVGGYEEFRYSSKFNLVQGGSLPEFSLAYETWGKLSPNKDNAILVFTGLSASSHARSGLKNEKQGWWENFIGPGLSMDTDKFYVASIYNPIQRFVATYLAAAMDLPDRNRSILLPGNPSPSNIVASQFKLLDYLGIDRLFGAVGASMGGMSSIAAAAMFPDRVGRLVSISAAARSHPYSIALRHTQRKVLISDPKWNNGDYYSSDSPEDGMRLSRQIATISYRSGPGILNITKEWESRFGRKRVEGTSTSPVSSDFLIETYLDHQGIRFSKEYDANSFLYLSKAMDTFNISARLTWANTHSSSTLVRETDRSIGFDLDQVVAGLSSIDMPTLVLGVQSDILFPVWQQKEYADAIRVGNKNVTYYELDTLFGHDTFLLDTVSVGGAMKGFLENMNI